MSPDRVIARAIAGLNVFSFLRCTTLDFIDAYLRNVEAEPAGRDVGMPAAIVKKPAASNVVGGAQYRQLPFGSNNADPGIEISWFR
jgi:hypothetical protein